MNSDIQDERPQLLNRLFSSRFAGYYLFALVFVLLSFLIRVALFAKTFDTLDPGLIAVMRIVLTGLFYDVVAVSYFSILLVLYLTALPDRLFGHPLHRLIFQGIYFIAIYLLVFNGVAEWIFWDEFGVRFNFIAVDYLVYTREVIGNIRQSYPLPKLLLAILCVTSLIGFGIWRQGWLQPSFAVATRFKQRAVHGLILLAAPIGFYLGVDASLADISPNRYHNELAKNGIYSLFSAFINNELEYDLFYLKRDEKEVFAKVRERLTTPDALLATTDPLDITRAISNLGPEKRLNVIYLTIESMSADFMALFGNTEGLTPNLDQLAKESLTFTNLYATGTRTDRGMESLVLSLPPTPGRSKVKRENNEDLFSSGFLFQQRGYDTQFIYGGYGYFDNMNYFFSHNGFGVVDRTYLAANEITHENVWGVADEDLLRRVILEADRAYGEGKPFYHFVMTTSNHRPFTYPSGRIDLPTGSRQGGVKYTDWAFGDFFKRAKERPWFDNTLFVITGDHCAGSAGKTDLPVERYHIPLMIYAPKQIAPRMEAALISQIDITPTVLGLLQWSYSSRFFGQDIFRSLPQSRRAFIGTYQKLGLISGDRLTVLLPQHKANSYRLGQNSQILLPEVDAEGLQDAISFYQSANIMRKKGLDKKLP
ncbi:MAG: sulfatase-like hydrolase/transferase [Magnetococcales bacterium]|nr:sulfatase-like hydrolase/transferase [Magnetococcales bacterium]